MAIQLCDKLRAGPPPIRAWLDKRELKPGDDWDEQIVEAIRKCHSLLFIMTRDSVAPQSICKQEWSRALKYKKPIIPILWHADAEIPFQLENRHYIQAPGDLEATLARLRDHLGFLHSDKGKLHTLKVRLMDAQRDLRRAHDPHQQQRIEDEIASLKQQMADQKRIIQDPEGERKRVQESIATGMERERQPKKPTSGVSKTKFINLPPAVAPTYFQNRHLETELIGDFLENEAGRLMTVVGRAGIGKTALVCRLLKSLEGARLPSNDENQDGGKALHVDGIVYLSERGSRKINFANLYFDLCHLLPNEVAQKLNERYKDASISTAEKMKGLLRAFPKGRYAVLFDNFEDKVNPETLQMDDEEIQEVFTAFLTGEPHAVKIILTTRIAPKNLALIEPAQQQRIDLDEGLDSPYAENILREMDTDGKVGLKEASNALLDEARQRTNGYPRALEALFAILSADRETSLSEILADTEKLLPGHVVEKMVGEAYSRLDNDAQLVMQALAIYGRPVSNVAIDYLLQPYLSGVDSAKVLNRLVNMRFVRKEGNLYYLHPIDRDYALGLIPKGKPLDKSRTGLVDRLKARLFSKIQHEEPIPFTQFALLERGAQFFKETRLPRKDWKNLDDLAPQFAEFELRCQSHNYETALGVLLEIDFDYLMLWGHSQLVLQYHQRLQGKIEDQSLKAYSLNNLGLCYHRLGDYSQAIEHHQQALVISQKIGDRQGEGNSINNLGVCYSNLGSYPKAIEYHQKSLEISREIGDHAGGGFSLGNLGRCYESLGKYDKAIEHHQQSLEICREIGDRQGEGSVLGYLGNCYESLGNYQKAIEYFQQSLEIFLEIGDRQGEGNVLGCLGNCYYNLGDYPKATEHYQQYSDISRKTESRADVGISLEILARTLLFLNDKQLAQTYLQDAVAIYEEIGSPNVVRAYSLFGLVLLQSGQHEEGKKSLEKAVERADVFLQQAESVDTLHCKALALCGLAIGERNQVYVEQAKATFAQARSITNAKGKVDRILKLFDLLAELDENGVLAGVREMAAGI